MASFSIDKKNNLVVPEEFPVTPTPKENRLLKGVIKVVKLFGRDFAVKFIAVLITSFVKKPEDVQAFINDVFEEVRA